ncbi:MAG TPA: IS4 family transposase, partial [Steroidobacteraceae bacterium]|nr:IS4 family transposase [Steroidobacteraceae bacterium]
QGGFLARKGDGEPGTKTIWIGYTNLLAYIKAINLVTKLK